MAVLLLFRFAKLAETNFGSLRHIAKIADADGRAVLHLNHGLANVRCVLHQSKDADVEHLLAVFEEVTAGVDVVRGKRLFHLGDREAVGDQLVGIDADLVFARDAAKAGHVDDVGHRFEALFEIPVLDRLHLHHVIARVAAL